jgi:hypothetical protein
LGLKLKVLIMLGERLVRPARQQYGRDFSEGDRLSIRELEQCDVKSKRTPATQ